MRPALLALAAASALSCTEKKPEPLSSLSPKPLPALEGPVAPDGGELDREALYRVEPAEVFGAKVPVEARKMRLEGNLARVGKEPFDLRSPADLARLRALLGDGAEVLVEADAESYLAQVAPFLALLDDAGARVLLLHPGGRVAFPVRLRDEPAFQAWLDEVAAGKVRVIQRADGFEVQTGMGKLAGPDPNGPTVPLRGGQLDVATLRKGLTQVKGRFDTAEDVCFVASFGTEVAKIAEGLTAAYEGMGEHLFGETCLVYPRPRK